MTSNPSPQSTDRRFYPTKDPVSEEVPGAERRTPLEAEEADSSPSKASHDAPSESSPSGIGPGPQVWPFLSDLEESLSLHVAGRDWPFRPQHDAAKLAETLETNKSASLTAVDAALLANSLAELPPGSNEQRSVLALLQSEAVEASLPSLPPGALSALVMGLGNIPGSAAECGGLRRRAMEELLARRPLHPRHVACLLATLGANADDGKPLVPPYKVLEVCAEVLSGKALELAPADCTAALEGLARHFRTTPRPVPFAADASTGDSHVVELTRLLLLALQGGPGLARLTLHSRDCPLAARVLASLLVLPPVEEADLSSWLKSMHSVRWPRELPLSVSEATFAAAACTLARFDAWAPARCSFLLAQAMRRDDMAKKHNQDRLPPAAAALWLDAIATSGLGLDNCTENVAVEDTLLSCIETMVLMNGDTSETTGNDVSAGADTESLARALYALRSLGKHEERGLGQALLDRLSDLDAKSFSSPTWLLLDKARSSLLAADADLPEAFTSPDWISALPALPAQSNAGQEDVKDQDATASE